MQNRKRIAFILLAILTLILTGCKKKTEAELSASESSQVSEAAQGTTQYIETPPYRETKADSRVVPKEIHYSIDGNESLAIERFDSDSRRILIGEAPDIGKYPTEYIIMLNDGKEWIQSQYRYTYDDDGRVLTAATYTDGTRGQAETPVFYPVEYAEYSYNYDGTLYRIINYEFDSNKNKIPTSVQVYEYDSNHYPVALRFFSDGVMYAYDLYTCNTNGDVIHAEEYSFDDTLYGTKNFEYSEDGRISKYEEFDSDGEIIMRKEYKYDSKDYLRRIDETDWYNSGGQMIETSEVGIVEYDAKDKSKLGNL